MSMYVLCIVSCRLFKRCLCYEWFNLNDFSRISFGYVSILSNGLHIENEIPWDFETAVCFLCIKLCFIMLVFFLFMFTSTKVFWFAYLFIFICMCAEIEEIIFESISYVCLLQQNLLSWNWRRIMCSRSIHWLSNSYLELESQCSHHFLRRPF